jgi:hypothetical protein
VLVERKATVYQRGFKDLRNYRAIIAGWLSHAAALIDSPHGELESQPNFLDLAPTDTADEAGVYSDALFAALANQRVFNIALTGPYGSGKSSIIKSFLKKYRTDSLQISLAAFLPESGPKNFDIEPGSVESTPVRTEPTKQERDRATKQEIERSILQQMLYGADANKLPFSRFKRIQIPGRWASIFISTFIALGLFSWWHLFQKRDVIANGDYFAPFGFSNWLNLTCFALGAVLFFLVVHRFYLASFGVSLKSLSLKDIQITPAAIDQESILNRHLDEIIYFFQATKYDLVIFEDLDRFNDPEIFVTLREINKIVNENSGVKRTVRFLYALRDDMFVNTDRTKFFEFIIPVIPIINSSNSIDMVIREGSRLSLDERLDRQFLREVSRYLTDLRLIKNIFNEYAIYAANLKTDDANVWNANKLLAVLIYKNIFPSDFEKLHRNEGSLAQILTRHDVYIAHIEGEYTAEILRLEREIELAEKQLPTDLQELRNIYAMALIQKLPDFTIQVSVDSSSFVPIGGLSKSEQFDQFAASAQIFCITQGQRHRIDISNFQEEVNSTQTYLERKEAIELKAGNRRNSVSKLISELRAKVSAVRVTKFNELIRQNSSDIEELFQAFKDNQDLARYLVFEGYLDDTYYQYTSLFHSGRLSPSDNKFLMQIRGYTNPDPDFQIDNPKEVIAAMRDEDFGQSYVLNVKIVDCLLSEPSEYAMQTAKLFEFIASDIEKCEAFFTAYYASGIAVSAMVSGLVQKWSGFVSAVLHETASLQHIAHIIAHLPEAELAALPGKYSDLPAFVSVNLQRILGLGIDFEPSRLKLLQIEATDLSSLQGYSAITHLLFDEGLYQLSIGNVDFIFRSLLGMEKEQKSLHKRHYTTVLKAGNGFLTAKIESSFAEYLDRILLNLEENTEESLSAILEVVKREELETDKLRAFLEKQSTFIPALVEVPVRLYAALFEIDKVEASWENCRAFLSSQAFDAKILTDYFNNDDTVAALSPLPIPDGEQTLALRKFLIENDGLKNDAYASYVRALPKPFEKFPEDLSWEKVHILIEEKKVSFSSANLAFLSEYDDAQIPFVAKNIDRYLEIESECATDEDFREGLLGSDISDEQKLKIIKAMDLNLLASEPSRAAKVGSIMQRVAADFSELGPEPSRAIIVNSQPTQVQISLLSKLQQKLDDEQIREILSLLPEPFSEIKPGRDIPRIESTEVNLKFVAWLKDRRFISSWSQGGWMGLDDDIRINNFRK